MNKNNVLSHLYVITEYFDISEYEFLLVFIWTVENMQYNEINTTAHTLLLAGKLK